MRRQEREKKWEHDKFGVFLAKKEKKRRSVLNYLRNFFFEGLLEKVKKKYSREQYQLTSLLQKTGS